MGDNVDKSVKARYMQMEQYSNKSLHYFHSFAVQNRIVFNYLPDVSPASCSNHPCEVARSLLPSSRHDAIIQSHFVTIISRILYSHMAFFKMVFDGCVEWHIKHKYYQQMCTKSHVLSYAKIDFLNV